MSAVVDRWGWRARIGLPPGTTATDLINATQALESGLGTRPGAMRVEPDPDRADHATIRVLTTDPHDHPIPYPIADRDGHRSVTDPIPIGLFEDAQPVMLRLSHRHGLLGGVAGAGKSGVLNVILAELVACPDVVLWGIDLKGGMELQPWTACLGRLATTPTDAARLLSDAVAVLDTRARQMAADSSRLWAPTPMAPALIVVIDEYAELADEAPIAISITDSIARRGRAVAVTLLAATQRPTQKAMGSGAVRSQMDVRICLRVRERRDVDLILGQGMLAAGWTADTLNAPGKFLISTPEHAIPRRARAYRVDDQAVATIAARHADQRPTLDTLSRGATDSTTEAEQTRARRHRRPDRSHRRALGRAEHGTASGLLGEGPDGGQRDGAQLGLLPTAGPRRGWTRRTDHSRPLGGQRRRGDAQMTPSSARTSAPPTRPHAQAHASYGRPRGRSGAHAAPTRRELVSLAAAAAYADVSVRTVRRYIAGGRLTGYRVGPRLIRVDMKELEDLARPIPAAEPAYFRTPGSIA